MKNLKIDILFRPKQALLLLMTAFTLTACSKKDDVTPTPEPQPTGPVRSADLVPYYKLQRVENLPAETNDQNPTDPKVEILFSLDYKKVQPANYARTSFWDLSFSGLYNSFLGGNSATDANNSGYQGPGKGGVAIIEKAFDDVTSIPASTAFKTGKGIIGTDNYGAFGEGIGWYLYDYDGTLIGKGASEKMHVAYAMSTPLSTSKGLLPARTVVVRLASGDYAKIKMISCYKDAFTPDKMFKDTPHMYFTFEYVIVPSTATQFEIK